MSILKIVNTFSDIFIIGLPPPPTHAHAMTLDVETKSMYILGGFAGDIQSRVTRIKLPHDLCNLWSGKREKCRLEITEI